MIPEPSGPASRPWWVNVLLAFCAFMTFAYTPWDLFWKPVAQDQEVWFGFVLRGWAAKATEPLHWAIYGAFTYGFWKMRPWMRFWGTVYFAQVAIAMVVWGLLDERGSLVGSVVSGIVFGWLTLKYWRAGEIFEASR
ncbi:MAG: hypothetical protein P8R42_09135 [Candidatus Binatia bacterium]|nr:hypothetical protein [Candidatus Binatia bacterium]